MRAVGAAAPAVVAGGVGASVAVTSPAPVRHQPAAWAAAPSSAEVSAPVEACAAGTALSAVAGAAFSLGGMIGAGLGGLVAGALSPTRHRAKIIAS
ncbi:hypothetical protein ACQPXS_45650 [Streptomyces sp. CA-142005]|uniref:hypothetical protein n=1 Tax=Streptomyces sp. CA-142005 TaxID=3240052 RepID=UPI003D93C06B